MIHEPGYFSRMRGLANSGTAEKLYLFWKGTPPREYKKARLYVDVGSSTYVDSVLKVPVATARELGFVSRSVYETWDKVDKAEEPGCGDIGIASGSVPSKEGEEANAGKTADEEAEASIRKRKYSRRGTALARQPSSDQVILYPRDMAGALMKELIYEAGAAWVLNGTPALGSAVYACLEMHIPCVAIVRGEKHRSELLRCLKERLVSELPVTGATLASCDIVKRAQTLGLAKPAAKKKAAKTTEMADEIDAASSPDNGAEDDDGDIDDDDVSTEILGEKKNKDKKKSKKDKKQQKAKKKSKK